MALASREVFFPDVGSGVLVWGNSFYVRASGTDKMRTRSTATASDKSDSLEQSFSTDNGRTWSNPETIEFIEQRPDGVLRRVHRPPFVDPATDRMIELMIHAFLPTDNPLEGLKTRSLYYRVSEDGGRSWTSDEQVIATGYAPEHPLPGVYTGRNGVNVGDRTCRPLPTTQKEILFPIQVAPLGPDGEYHNPGGGHTYGEAAAVIGRWDGPDRLRWELGERAPVDPGRSTRGSLEPTLAELEDGRILMVMRGSNDVKPDLPGCKWYAVSEDGGRTWDEARPWRFSGGDQFFSPSSCSQLLRHSTGRLFWLGNLTAANPRGNRPRYPLVAGQVDNTTGLLIRPSVQIIDDRGPDDDADLTLSNFMAHEDRETGEIILHMSRPFAHKARDRRTAAYLYRIDPYRIDPYRIAV